MFAAFGALGGLAGAAAGETLVAALAAAQGAAAPAPAAGQAAPGQPKDQPARAQEDEGVESIFGKMPISPARRREIEKVVEKGEIEIGLAWHNHNDLDLHCIEPSGERINFYSKRSSSGGYLDIDANVSEPYQDEPVEHIRWKKGEAPEGHYKVFVRYYANHGGTDPTPFAVGIKAPGMAEPKTFNASLSRGDSEYAVYEFEVGPRQVVKTVVAEANPAAAPRFLLAMVLATLYSV